MAIAARPPTTVTSLTKAFYSPAEVAELASVSPSTILNYIKAGKLPAVRLSERLIRIPRKAVVRLLELDEAAPVIRDRPHAAVRI